MFVFAHCTSNTYMLAVSKRTHTLSARGIEETNKNPYVHVISYRSRRGPLPTLPRSLPVPRMKRFTFDPIRRLAMNSRITNHKLSRKNHELSGPVSDRCPVVNNSPVCSRVLAVCQHRPVLYPLDISTIQAQSTKQC